MESIDSFILLKTRYSRLKQFILQGKGMSKLFRENPAYDVVVLMLTELGLTGLQDTKPFAMEELKLETLDKWAPLLEPYYLPCKAKRYFNSLDGRRVITIMKHVLPHHGFKLQSNERNYMGRKRTVYQIHPATPRTVAMDQDICVMFL